MKVYVVDITHIHQTSLHPLGVEFKCVRVSSPNVSFVFTCRPLLKWQGFSHNLLVVVKYNLGASLNGLV